VDILQLRYPIAASVKVPMYRFNGVFASTKTPRRASLDLDEASTLVNHIRVSQSATNQFNCHYEQLDVKTKCVENSI